GRALPGGVRAHPRLRPVHSRAGFSALRAIRGSGGALARGGRRVPARAAHGGDARHRGRTRARIDARGLLAGEHLARPGLRPGCGARRPRFGAPRGGGARRAYQGASGGGSSGAPPPARAAFAARRILLVAGRAGAAPKGRAEPDRLGKERETDVRGRGRATLTPALSQGGGTTLMASVHIRNVQKYFGGTQVIRGVDVDIADGEFAVLVGPSGCGKSTLLRMIAGLEEISGGEIQIGGRVVNNTPPKERDIAMVFQNYALYPHMKVRDNMAFSLLLAKRPRSEIDARVTKAASILGLEEFLDRYPRQLSGGQRQRVAMGRAIVRDPQVFLFDEPLSNLDAKLRVAMRTELKELHQRLKTTSVYVTHDQIEAMTMGDQIVVMRDGRVEQIGDPLELYDTPANIFVAGFIGSPAMNLVPGTARVNGTGPGVEFEGGLRLPLPHAAQASDGQAVLYGMRPEHCAPSDAAGLPAEVVVVEPTGADTQLFCRFNGQDISSLVRERVSCRPGDRIRLAPDPARVHVF